MNKGINCFSVCAEEAAVAEVHAGRNRVEGIGAQVLAAERDNRRLVCEKTDNLRRPQLADNDRENAVDHAGADGDVQRLQCAVVLAGARILRRDGGDGGEHGRRDQEQEADDLLHDADGGGHIHAAAVGDCRDHQEGNLDQPVLTGHRNTDPQNPGEDLSVRL